jgi:hypothetical protein
MITNKTLEHGKRSVELFQLAVGATVAFAGAAAILRLSNLWTTTDVRYGEYFVILFWGVLLMAGALRHRQRQS